MDAGVVRTDQDRVLPEILIAVGILLAWIVAALSIFPFPPWAGALVAIGLTCLPILLHVWLPKRRMRLDKLSRLRATSFRGGWHWAVVALFCTPIWAISLLLVHLQLLPLGEAPPDYLTIYAEERGGWLAVAILTVGFGPLVEEFVLRGWIQGALERVVSPVPAILVPAFLYALLHGRADALPLYLGIGCIFGWGVWRSGSVWVGVLMHASYNASLLTVSALQDHQVGPFSLDMTFTSMQLTGLVFVGGIALCATFLIGQRGASDGMTEGAPAQRQSVRSPG